MCLLFVLLLTVGFCEGDVRSLSVLLRNGQYVSCPSELCPASKQVFRCIIDGAALQWQPFFNGTGQSVLILSTGNHVGFNETQGNFTYNLTSNTVPNVTSIAVVNYGMSRSIGSDTLRCTDVGQSSLECSLVQKAEPGSCDSALLNNVLTNEDSASAVNIHVNWSTSDCAVIYHYKLNPPLANVSEGTTDMTFVSIIGIPADGTVYNVIITPIDFLGTRGPTCQTPSFSFNLVSSPSSCPSPSCPSPSPSCSPNDPCDSDCLFNRREGIIIVVFMIFLVIVLIILLVIILFILIKWLCDKAKPPQ